MGGNIGCVCVENRAKGGHETPINGVPTPEELGLDEKIIDFSLESPRSQRFTAVQLEKRRIAAQNWLNVAIAGGDPNIIQDAIYRGRLAGVTQAELDDAEAALKRASKRQNARQALARAVEQRDESSLREAVCLADKAGVDASEFEEAMALIEQLEADEGEENPSDEQSARRRAVAQLDQAMRGRGQRELMDAIAEAEAAGMGTKHQRALLAQARVMLKIVTARKQAARARRAKDCLASAEVGTISSLHN
uniref:Uncharacterized protein n=1 Tax=Pyrodinium bahamense TaxID=73915 RepID=A0A7S0B978_9DINO